MINIRPKKGAKSYQYFEGFAITGTRKGGYLYGIRTDKSL